MTQPALANEIYAQPLPDFFPERLRLACAGKRIEYRLSASVRERMQVPEDIDTAEWAEKYRRVTAIDAHPGRWRNELVPHAVKAMQFTSQPGVREVWLCWPERAAKTNVILNAAMRQVDRGIDSGNIFWLMPNEHEAKKAIGERVIEALRATPRTARLLSRYADDTTRTIIRFRHGPRLFAAWAGSAASVSSFFGRLCIFDECDKAETTGVGKETDILTLLYKRGRDRDDSKFLFVSTPAQGYIYPGTMACAQVWEYRSRCPHCRELVTLSADNIVIHQGATAEDVKNGTVRPAINCGECGVEWSDHDRMIAYHQGGWVCIKGEDLENPESVGMHLSAYTLPNIPLKEIAEKIVAARTGGITEKRALANGYDCVDFSEEISDRKEDAILLLRDDRPEGLVPSVQIAAITAVADMQKRGFWYKITAWGYGLEQESWTLKNGYVDSWEALRLLFYETEFQDVAGNTHVISLRGMDSGGGESEQWADLSRTAEAYLFACKNPGMLLFKGQKRMTKPFTVTDLDRLPGTNKPLPGSVKLYNLNSKHFKDRLAAKLMIDPTDPGAWHLHKDADVDFARQMCAEGKDEAGFWVCPRGKANHYWDCSYMEIALVEIAQVKLWKRPEEQHAVQRRIISKGVNRSD